jgi:hypothetical protein
MTGLLLGCAGCIAVAALGGVSVIVRGILELAGVF